MFIKVFQQRYVFHRDSQIAIGETKNLKNT